MGISPESDRESDSVCSFSNTSWPEVSTHSGSAETFHIDHAAFRLSAKSTLDVDDVDPQGVLTVQRVSGDRRYTDKTMDVAVAASRTQCSLLLGKHCTMHGMQGKQWTLASLCPIRVLWVSARSPSGWPTTRVCCVLEALRGC